jgi:hypothetical protein
LDKPLISERNCMGFRYRPEDLAQWIADPSGDALALRAPTAIDSYERPPPAGPSEEYPASYGPRLGENALHAGTPGAS